MQVNKHLFNSQSNINNMLIEHFNYSIKDINSYEELTDEEKKICPKELFDQITT